MTELAILKKCISKWFIDKMQFSLNEQQLNSLCKQISDKQKLILSDGSRSAYVLKNGNINFHLKNGTIEHVYNIDEKKEFATCECGRVLKSR